MQNDHIEPEDASGSRMGGSRYVDETQILEQYLQEIRQYPLLSREEEFTIAKQIEQHSQAAFHQLIQSNLRLVVKMAKRYIHSSMSLLDLIEEGNLGLIRAVEKFNPDLGFRFSTYAAWWIQQTIERAIMNQGRTVRLPVHVSKALNKCLRTKKRLSHEQFMEPNAVDIADALNTDKASVEWVMSFNDKTISLDAATPDSMQRSLSDDLSLESHIASDQQRQIIEALLSKLTPKQREVIIHRYGIHGQDSKTLDATGEEIGMTRERVRQLQADALLRLKRLMDIQSVGREHFFGQGD